MDPTFAKPSTNLISASQPIEIPIVRNDLCMRGKSASYVHHIEFDLSGTHLEGGFRPGQSIGVTPPGLDANGQPEGTRLYSLSSPTFGEDGMGKIVSTTCKRLVDEFRAELTDQKSPSHGLHVGVCSNYLCSKRPGDTVMVSGPSGKKFLLPEDHHAHQYVFMATGTGIAPYRGMIKELLYGPYGTVSNEIHLVMGVPYASDLLYDDFFTRAAEEHENFHYHTVFSRENGGNGKMGYVHQYLAQGDHRVNECLSEPTTLLYLCGLKGMQIGVFQSLARQPFADDYVRIPATLLDDPSQWSALEARRVRPKKRCMVEVY